MSVAHICGITCLIQTINFTRQKKGRWSTGSNLAALVSCSDRHSDMVAAGHLVWPTTRINPSGAILDWRPVEYKQCSESPSSRRDTV